MQCWSAKPCISDHTYKHTTISGRVKRCVTLPAAWIVAARVWALQQNRFAAGLALTAWNVARLDAKETGVSDSC